MQYTEKAICRMGNQQDMPMEYMALPEAERLDAIMAFLVRFLVARAEQAFMGLPHRVTKVSLSVGNMLVIFVEMYE